MEFTPKHFNLFADFQRHAGLLSAAVDLLRDAATAAAPDAGAGLAAIQKLERDGATRSCGAPSSNWTAN